MAKFTAIPLTSAIVSLLDKIFESEPTKEIFRKIKEFFSKKGVTKTFILLNKEKSIEFLKEELEKLLNEQDILELTKEYQREKEKTNENITYIIRKENSSKDTQHGAINKSHVHLEGELNHTENNQS